MEKHNLKPREVDRMVRQLWEMKLGEILFSFFDGPQYDLVLNLIATLT